MKLTELSNLLKRDVVVSAKENNLIIVQDKQTKEYVVFPNVKAILKEINSDRSDEWTDYTEEDWKEGLKEFTEFKLISDSARKA